MKRKRCTKCQSLHTKKQGSYLVEASACWGKRKRKIQRYYCFDCQATFSKRAEPKRCEPALVRKAADLYFNAEVSKD